MPLSFLQVCVQVSSKVWSWKGHCLPSKCYCISPNVSSWNSPLFARNIEEQIIFFSASFLDWIKWTRILQAKTLILHSLANLNDCFPYWLLSLCSVILSQVVRVKDLTIHWIKWVPWLVTFSWHDMFSSFTIYCMFRKWLHASVGARKCENLFLWSTDPWIGKS